MLKLNNLSSFVRFNFGEESKRAWRGRISGGESGEAFDERLVQLSLLYRSYIDILALLLSY